MRRSPLIFAAVTLLLQACATKTPTIAPIVPEKFTCLSTPNGAYQAGTIIRTISGVAAPAKAAPDNLTVAYLPLKEASLSSDYIDIEQTIATGLTASATAKQLEKLGATVSLNAQATYAIDVHAKKNKVLIGDDELMYATAKHLRQREGLIAGAKYFFIKEALGSQELLYKAKTGASIDANAQLTADKSGLATKVNLLDRERKLASQAFLIACVVLEEIAIAKDSSAADGTDLIKISNNGTVPGPAIANILTDAQPAR